MEPEVRLPRELRPICDVLLNNRTRLNAGLFYTAEFVLQGVLPLELEVFSAIARARRPDALCLRMEDFQTDSRSAASALLHFLGVPQPQIAASLKIMSGVLLPMSSAHTTSSHELGAANSSLNLSQTNGHVNPSNLAANDVRNMWRVLHSNSTLCNALASAATALGYDVGSRYYCGRSSLGIAS